MKDGRTKAYIMFISTMLIFGTIGIFRKYIPLPSSLIASARGFLGALVLFVFVKLTKRGISGKIGRGSVLLLILSGALMGANWILLFESYNYTTVGTATLCYYMAPTVVILLSPLFFGEKLTAKKLVCVAVSLVGMVLVSGFLEGNTVGTDDTKGVILGVGAAILYASVIILNKKTEADDAYEKTVIQLFSAAVVLVPYLIFTVDFGDVSFTPISVVMLLILGVFHTGVTYALYFSSIRYLPAQSIALLSYIDPVSTLIFSAIFLSESLTHFGLLGAVLIIGSALICEINFGRKENV